jgi:carboxypeptidase D
VDQPVGTGYSYTETHSFRKTEKEVVSDFLGFLNNFYKIFPEFNKKQVRLFILQ